jgi:hypothetical protein
MAETNEVPLRAHRTGTSMERAFATEMARRVVGRAVKQQARHRNAETDRRAGMIEGARSGDLALVTQAERQRRA